MRDREPTIGAGGDYELRRPENKIVEMSKAEYVHVVDPDHVEPETVTTTASTTLPCGCRLSEGLVRPCEKHSPTAPNRFDPYEALDTIFSVLTGPGVSTTSGCTLSLGDYDTILNQVRSLRAYITGMER